MSRYRNNKPQTKLNKVNLPNGFGQISHLAGDRRNPYAVYPPAERVEELGLDGLMRTRYKRQPALCYVDDWIIAFMVLTKYHAGEYRPGDELELSRAYHAQLASESAVDVINRFMADFSVRYSGIERAEKGKKTFGNMYAEYYTWKFEREGHREYSKNTMRSIDNAFKHCEPLHDKPFENISHLDLQALLDKISIKGSSKVNVRKFLTDMWRYARTTEQTESRAADDLEIYDTSTENGSPFSERDIARLWELRNEDTIAETLLIMIMSGFRISEYVDMEEVNMEEWYFRGGVKTKAGKNRIVPVHSAIRDLVKHRMQRDGRLIRVATPGGFRHQMEMFLKKHPEISQGHTPHDTRHTFSMLCERYVSNDFDAKRMLGHAVNDITRGTYGHRTLADLRKSIEEINLVEIVLQVTK